MTGEQDNCERREDLRRRAEARVEPRIMDFPAMSRGKIRELAHELQTHQIELEMQNEELRRIQRELTESRDRYSDLYDFAPVGYVTIDQHGLIHEANLTLAEMLGLVRSDLIGKPLSTFVSPDDQDTLHKHCRGIQRLHARGVCQVRFVREALDPLWVEVESILIGASDIGTAYLRTIITDITDRRRALDEKRTLEQQLLLAQKFESLGVLAGGIAHDFNNILTTILGHAALVLDRLPLRSAVRNSIVEIEMASKRAADIADQMLAYSGKGQFIIKNIDLATLVSGMSHLLAVSISKKVEFRTHFASDLPTVKGDMTQLRQVIMNLILNAAEAIGEQAGVLTLSTGLMECDRAYLDAVARHIRAHDDPPPPEGSYVYFEVSDTGSGMTAETMERIFDPFFTTKFTGRGLGLAAVQGIVRGHRGVIQVQSEIGKGTTFKIFFPAGERKRRLAVVRTEGDAEPETWRGSGTVLFVDDVKAIRAVSQRMLEHLGFDVITAADGLDAVEAFRQHAGEIVCVLLDLTMPGLDGREAFQEMHRLHPVIPVILCSGYTEHATAREFLGKGVASFLKKPFDLRGLRRKLREVLEKPNAGN